MIYGVAVKAGWWRSKAVAVYGTGAVAVLLCVKLQYSIMAAVTMLRK